MWANGHALVRPEKPSRGSTQPRATARVAANRLSARHHRPLRGCAAPGAARVASRLVRRRPPATFGSPPVHTALLTADVGSSCWATSVLSARSCCEQEHLMDHNALGGCGPAVCGRGIAVAAAAFRAAPQRPRRTGLGRQFFDFAKPAYCPPAGRSFSSPNTVLRLDPHQQVADRSFRRRRKLFVVRRVAVATPCPLKHSPVVCLQQRPRAALARDAVRGLLHGVRRQAAAPSAAASRAAGRPERDAVSSELAAARRRRAWLAH